MKNSYNIWNNLTWPVPDTHRVVFEENRTVLIIDIDQAGDHHKDEEAEDCNHNHLRTIRESVHKWMENSNNHLMTTREVQKSGKI